jgi:hypothetical protein
VMMQMVQLGAVSDDEDTCLRPRGGESNLQVQDDIEGLVSWAASGDDEIHAGFMRAHGAPEAADDTIAEDNPNAIGVAGGWPEERLNRPAHPHTSLTVKQVMYGLMRTAAGNIRQGPVDNMIKVIKAAMPQPNKLPRCVPAQHCCHPNRSCTIRAQSLHACTTQVTITL